MTEVKQPRDLWEAIRTGLVRLVYRSPDGEDSYITLQESRPRILTYDHYASTKYRWTDLDGRYRYKNFVDAFTRNTEEGRRII